MVATQVKAEIQCLWVSAIGLKGLSKCFYHPSVVNFQKFCGQKGQKQAKSAKVYIWLRTPLPSAEKIHTFYLFFMASLTKSVMNWRKIQMWNSDIPRSIEMTHISSDYGLKATLLLHHLISLIRLNNYRSPNQVICLLTNCLTLSCSTSGTGSRHHVTMPISQQCGHCWHGDHHVNSVLRT